jgi:hypothetical protein
MALHGLAQTAGQKAMEKDLRRESALTLSYVYSNSDSLSRHSSLFTEKLNSYLAGDPSTLGYGFPLLTDSNDCWIAGSKDGLFRIYSRDTHTGGTMHFFENIYQYKVNGNVYVKPLQLEEGDPSGIYSDMLSIKTAARTYYIALQTGIYSTKDVGKRIRAYAIENNALNDSVKLFKGYKGLVNLVDIGSELFKDDDWRRLDGNIKIVYDPVKKLISIPQITIDDKVIVNYPLYRFTGAYFERVYPK